MANRYIRDAGGNYNAAGTWESSPGAADAVSVPGSADAVIATATSGNLTVTAGAATLSSLTLAGGATLSPGQSAQWTATAGLGDGFTQNVSSSAA